MRKMRALLAACVAAVAATEATAGVLGSAAIEDCLVTEDGLYCDEATATTFAVSYGLSAVAELVFLSPVEETLKLELSKSLPTVTYPLIYDHTVDYAPKGPSGLLFDGYRIGEPVVDYVIQGKRIQGASVDEFRLSPEEPVRDLPDDPDLDGDFPLRAELVGDLSAYKGLPQLDNFFLYIPASPASHPFVENWQQNMLLVPREEVSYRGTECNKVGYIPKTRLARKYGLCLNNQLVDKHTADLERLVQNPEVEATYLVAGMRAFKRTKWFSDRSGQKLISFERPEIQNTQVIVVTGRVDETRTLATESAGIIREAEVLVDSFASHSRDGSLRVEIQNVGDLKTGYIVEVTNCNDNIVGALPAQARTLEPFQQAELYFDLYTTGNSATSNACSVTLTSPRGKLYDNVQVLFDTAATPVP